MLNTENDMHFSIYKFIVYFKFHENWFYIIVCPYNVLE